MIKKALAFGALIFGLATGKALASCSSSMPYTFTASSYLSYATTNANNNFLLSCVSSVDNTQIGGAGLYASQIIPTTSANATFGGAQNYTFPASLNVNQSLAIGASGSGELIATEAGKNYHQFIDATGTYIGWFNGTTSTTLPTQIKLSDGSFQAQNLTALGNASITGTLGAGATTVSSLSSGAISGTTGSFSGTLGAGATTVSSLSSGAIAGTNGTFSGTLGVTGATSLSGGASVTGNAAVSGTVSSGSSGVDSLHPYSSGCTTLNVFSSGVNPTNGVLPSGLGFYCGGTSTQIGALSSGGSLGLAGGTTVGGAVQQVISGTTYTLPYDGQSTSASTNTHLEHGNVTTGTYSGGYACAPFQNFTRAYTLAPTVVISNQNGSGPLGPTYLQTVTSAGFQACEYVPGQGTSFSTLSWISLGE